MRAISRSFTSGRMANESTARLHFFTNSRTLVTLLLSSVVSPFAMAQVTPAAKVQISPEAMAMHLRAKRTVAKPDVAPRPAASSVPTSSFNTDQGPGPGPIGPGPGCNLFPAPPSVGAAVPLSYFGPSPSTTNPSLVGPVQLLNSGPIDTAKGTITIPLYKGSLKGTNKNIWYILTDTSNQGVAAELGLNFSAKLNFASNAARTGNLDDNGNIVFDKGTVTLRPREA